MDGSVVALEDVTFDIGEAEFIIDLPRPRRLGRLPDHFNDYTDRIRHIFQSAGVPAFD